MGRNIRTNFVYHLRMLGRSYKQIGEHYGFSHQRARQLFKIAERQDRDEIRQMIADQKRNFGYEHITLGMLLWCANEIGENK